MNKDHYATEQEAFWAGDFGNDYIGRNQGDQLLASNLQFFSKALAQTVRCESCIEFGANIGMNIRALKLLHPDMKFNAIEINSQAAEELGKVIGPGNVHCQSITEFSPTGQWDIALIKGVLIHINPDVLDQVYSRLVQSTSRYMLVCEYYNPEPVAIPYRGHSDRLFKRDFAGEIMERHPEMKLVDYGFTYRRDPKFPQDDITWFLMEKAATVGANR
ncbi:pseudaminic acid biosynthesis-associated methylase [Shinella sp. H4-D48]|uniref:pseudaminic acid biosynthesis-associated methylase n=1 Tax=Shinella sp. H4-D48 TaxID=2925841 RepID=UPI001F53248A|nr:pseudaminic acid biosynthesis-associated methylase [Shinella sp. H4-D48]UNK38225.1 pseudaminic acid biosynthesis-associated methylase [Shinella sp. H4-D48]